MAAPTRRGTGGRSEQIRGSVYDRLLADDATAETGGVRLEALRDAVRRDLESLLNTRYRCVGWEPSLEELDTSIINFGVPDLLSNNLSSRSQREGFVKILESTIKKHEPRFTSVTAHLLDNSDPLDRTLRFRIEAMMHLEPYGEQIIFDSVVDPTSRSIAIQAQ